MLRVEFKDCPQGHRMTRWTPEENFVCIICKELEA